jgi:hypothetical protein
MDKNELSEWLGIAPADILVWGAVLPSERCIL